MNYTVALSRNIYLPPADKSRERVKSAKCQASAEFQEEQKRQPNHVTLNADELATKIKAGYCVRGALLSPMNDSCTDIDKNGRQTYNTDRAFVKQGAILLDFDNKSDPLPELNTADGVRDLVNGKIGQNAVSIVSESWTSSEMLRKWHVFLLLKKPCDDLARVKTVIRYLVDDLFKGLADKACKDPARYVLGSTPDKITQSYNGVLDLDALPAAEFTAPNNVAAPPKYKVQSAPPIGTDMTPDRLAEIILNSRCDFGADGYSEYLSCCTALYHIAGVSSEIISSWGSTYDGTQQNPHQWESMNRNGTFTIGTLKKFANQLNPAAFDAYKRELFSKNDFGAYLKSQALNCDGIPETEQPPADPREWSEEQWHIFAAWHYKAPFDPDSAAPFARFKNLVLQCWRHDLLRYGKLPGYLQPMFKTKKIEGVEQSCITGFCINPIPLARDLTESLHIVNISGSTQQGLVYAYKQGKYIKVDPEQERGIIRGRLEVFDRDGSMWNTKTIRDCSTILHSPLETHTLDDFNADESLINFANGLLDIRTGELKPHDPAVLSTVQLPLDYDPNAGTETPCFDNLIGHLSSGDEEVRKMLLQICALAISNINISQLKMFLLIYGARDSGKSVLFSLLSRLLGAENTHTTSLYLLEENRFEPINLCGKRLAGSPELDNNSVVHHVGIIKALTGDDFVRAEIKCGGTYNFQFRGVLLFSSNDRPHLPSADDAFYYRLRLVEVPQSVKNKDPDFLEKLFGERPRIINKLLPYLLEVVQAGAVIDPDSSKQLKKSYRAENAIEIAFFNECCTMREQLTRVTDNQTRTFIYRKFREWCIENGVDRGIPSSREFTNRLDRYIIEEKLCTYGAMLDKRNGRFYTFTYHEPNHAQTFAAEYSSA